MEDKTVRSVLQFFEFFATWCPHCQKMIPLMDQLEKERTDIEIKRYDVDAAQSEQLMKLYTVDGVPAYIIVKEGQPVWHGTGEMTVDDLKNRIDTYK